jgi:AcrR family transcriptional regulator
MVASPTHASEAAGPGRPQLHDDDEILTAALTAFAFAGYEAMSIRSLARDLGLSHGALHKRYESKERLFYAAVDHGFGGLVVAINAYLGRCPEPESEIDVVRNSIRAFLLASSDRPEIVRLMNIEGISDSPRLEYIFEQFIAPLIEPLRQAVLRGRPNALSRITTRDLFFIVAHGAVAPFTLRALSDRFDQLDGRLDPEAYAESMADAVLRTLGN